VAATRRAFRILGWLAGGVFLLVLCAAALIWFGGSPILTWVVEHPVSAYLGRQINLGKLTVRWGNPSEIVAENVAVANATWGTQPQMFTARRLAVKVYFRSLISGAARVPLISLDDAKLLLETSKSGEKNWNFGLKSAAPKTRHHFPILSRLVIRQSELLYHNGKTDANTTLGIDHLDVDEPRVTEPVRFTASGSFQHAPLKLSGSLGPLASLRNTAKPYPVGFDGDLDQVRLRIEGGVAEPLNFNGLDLRLSLSGANLHTVAGMFGVPLPPLPNFHGRAKLTGGDARFALQAISLKAGNSDLEGGIDIDANGKVPRLIANFTSSQIDLADFKGFVGAKPAHSSAPMPAPPPSPAGSHVLPDVPIAVKKLPGVNATLSFYGTRIIASDGLPLQAIYLDVKLEGGELFVDPLRFHAADGDVSLSFHFNPYTQNSPPLMQADLQISHVDLHKFFDRPSMPAMMRPTEGIIGGFAKIGTTGVTTRQFLSRMNGEAGIFMENGQVGALLNELAPIDVLGALGVYVAGGKPVPINCMVAHFNITDGFAKLGTFLVDTKGDIINGSGHVDFGQEVLDLTFTPHNKQVTLLSLHTPVHITGTLGKPAFHVETLNIIARIGAAVGLGVVFPPAALLPLIDTGLGAHNACGAAFAAQPPAGRPNSASGSSVPPKAPAAK
jgi:uncharacterized protein involved in outer membrane biogenesis